MNLDILMVVVGLVILIGVVLFFAGYLAHNSGMGWSYGLKVGAAVIAGLALFAVGFALVIKGAVL